MSMSGWQMLGNDRHGDCVAVSFANFVRHVTANLSKEEYPGYEEVIRFYKTQNPRFPAQDNGMVIQYALKEWMDHGFGGRKLVAFAEVNAKDPEEMEAAIAIFGGLILGVTVTSANNKQFANRQPWDLASGARDGGGHAILSGDYSGNSASNIGFITWATATRFTDRYLQSKCFEAWVPILPEHLGSASFLAGVSRQRLSECFKSLTGNDLAIPDDPVVVDGIEKRVERLESTNRLLTSMVQYLSAEVGELRKRVQ